jgi:uncharacterized membrane protein
MPYCCQCGTVAGERDVFCAQCGARQASAKPDVAADFMAGIDPRTASVLCYLPFLGLIASIVVLASARFRHDSWVRFDAFQSVYVFVAWLVLDRVASPLFGFPFVGGHNDSFFPGLLKAAVIGLWIFMMVKASQHERYKLPVLGDLAEKSVTEQR